MLFIFRPQSTKDKLEIRVYDTEQDRCFYTAEDMLVINVDDIAQRLDDFVGLSKEEKETLVVEINCAADNENVSELIRKFREIE